MLRVDEGRAAVVRRAYGLAATGATDREVAAATGLKETHVGEILTNPVYAGRLRTGEALGIAPLIDAGLWSRVQTARERRRTRMPGRIVKRQYALRLRCLGCGRFLYGDVGRYRHPSPTCEAFRVAVPLIRRQRTPADDTRIKGHSYPQAWYEGAIGALLGEIGSVDEATLAEVVRLHAAYRPEVDELALARIDREREAATRKLAQTRDVVAWQAAMGRLDAAEALARQPPAGDASRRRGRRLPALAARPVGGLGARRPSDHHHGGLRPDGRAGVRADGSSSHPTRSPWVSTGRCQRSSSSGPDR